MSLFDKAKERAAEAAALTKSAAEKAAEAAKLAATGAAQKINEGGYIDRAASTIDEKTGGKYSDKITKVASSTQGAVTKLAETPDGGSAAPQAQPGPATTDESQASFTDEGAPPAPAPDVSSPEGDNPQP